jgi:lipoprotein NlpI
MKELLRVLFAITVLSLLTTGIVSAAETASYKELQREAQSAYAKGQNDEAITLITRAIAIEPQNPRGYFVRARYYEDNREPAKAIADYDQVIKLDPRQPDAWQHRGGEHFKLGHIKESIADFDQFIALVPQQAPHHWQRGISLYYAGRFADGRKQFELHQTVNPNDVENAVWHFLCVARAASVEKARAALIPINGDGRVPMMEVHALFADKIKPEEVLKAASAGNLTPAQRQRQLFYAHLYLGLYFEVLGDDQKAREHITKAAVEYQTGDYMGDVARVHLQLRWPK